MAKVVVEISGYELKTRLDDVPQVGDEVMISEEMLAGTEEAGVPEYYFGCVYLVTGRRWQFERGKTRCLLELKVL